MSLSECKLLLSAAAVTLLATAPAPVAWAAGPEGNLIAQPPDDDDEEEEDKDDKDAESPPETAPKPKDLPPVEEGAWGVGGEDEEGRYAPRGKTGKLKELEKEDAEQRGEDLPMELPRPGLIWLDTAIAFGDIYTPTALSDLSDTGNPTHVTPTASFLIGARYRIGDTWQLGVRFPISTGQIDGDIEPPSGTDPDNYAQIATGALEVSVAPHFIVGSTWRLPVRIALTFPTGAGDVWADVDNRPDRWIAAVNQAASESRGWEDRALFSHKRFGIIPGLGAIHRSEVGPGILEFSANTKVEIMISTGGTEPPEVTDDTEKRGEKRGVAVNWVTPLGLFYGFFKGMLDPGLRVWLAVGTATDIKNQDLGGATFVFEPNLRTHIPFTDSGSVGIDARVAYTIPLGQVSEIGALRVGAGLFF